MAVTDSSVRAGIYALTIEGVGTPDGLYRFVWGTGAGCPVDLSTVDPDGLYVEGLTGWPREIETRVDFLAGEVRTGGQAFTLRRTPLTLASLWTVDALPICRLVSEVGATSQTLAFEEGDHALLQGRVVYLEREAILVGTLASTVSGVSTYNSCQRGQLSTLALPHGGEGRDPEVYATCSSETLQGRLVRLLYIPSTATSYADEQVVFTGPLSEVSASHAGEFTLQVGTLLDLVRRGKICRDMWTSMPGRTLEADRRPDAGHSGDASALFCVDGQYVVRGLWRQAGQSRWRVELGEPVFGSPPLPGYSSADLEGLEVREVLTSLDEQPSNSASPSTATLPLSQTVADQLLQILTSTENQGASGVNGAWDTGLDNLAGMVPLSVVDADQILAWGSQYGTQAIDNQILGWQGPEDTLDLLQRMVRPFGGVLVPGPAKIRVAQLRSIAPYGQANRINQDQILTVGVQQARNLAHAVDRVEIKYNAFPGRDPDTTTGSNAYRRRRLPRGVADTVSIDAGVIKGQEAASLLATNLTLRYHQPPPEVLLECLRTADYVPGDVVLVTHSRLLGNGVVGVTDAPFLVVGRREVLQGPEQGAGSHRIILRCLYVGALFTNAGLIGPTATVASWNSGSNTLTVNSNDWTAAGGALGSDAAGFAAGDVVHLLDQYWSNKALTLEVASVSGNALTLTSAPATAPAAGDIIMGADWPDSSAGERAAWAFFADSDDEIDGDAANTYQYT